MAKQGNEERSGPPRSWSALIGELTSAGRKCPAFVSGAQEITVDLACFEAEWGSVAEARVFGLRFRAGTAALSTEVIEVIDRDPASAMLRLRTAREYDQFLELTWVPGETPPEPGRR